MPRTHDVVLTSIFVPSVKPRSLKQLDPWPRRISQREQWCQLAFIIYHRTADAEQRSPRAVIALISGWKFYARAIYRARQVKTSCGLPSHGNNVSLSGPDILRECNQDLLRLRLLDISNRGTREASKKVRHQSRPNSLRTSWCGIPSPPLLKNASAASMSAAAWSVNSPSELAGTTSQSTASAKSNLRVTDRSSSGIRSTRACNSLRLTIKVAHLLSQDTAQVLH